MTYETITKLSRPKNYGVAIVDMQPGYLVNIGSKKKKLISAQQEILDVCIENDRPILVFEMNRGGNTTSELTEIIKKSNRKYKINKSASNGFVNQAAKVKRFLNKWEVTDLCLMGIYALGCVRATARGAVENGIGVLTAKQLITDPFFSGGSWPEVKTWFNNNGTYFNDYQDVLRLLRGK